ncbi:MAG: 4-hydroxy-2-oxovalerate aldolase [Planctomycetes bacterium]|nr:4-hydroxy-2-oxovalerate aldolase [Planctomycetota bacterium]
MRPSKTLAKLRDGELVRLCCLGHFIPSYIRHAAHFGFDCIWLDLEHRVMDEREVQALLAFFHLYDIDCMLRPPTLEKTRLYRYLEDGATGLMIPHVSTPEKAEMLVQAVKFPPLGDRGIDGAGLDSEFFVRGGDGYTDRANRETFLVVQIETPEAVENAEAIASIDGIDGMFIGPGDLGLRLAKTDTKMTIDEAFARVAAAAEKQGKAWGCPASTALELQKLHDQGARLLSHGGEFMTLMKMLEQSAANFDAVPGK